MNATEKPIFSSCADASASAETKEEKVARLAREDQERAEHRQKLADNAATAWDKYTGKDATARLLFAGQENTTFANAIPTRSTRYDDVVDNIRKRNVGTFGRKDQRRLTLSMRAYHISLRVPKLANLPVHYVESVVSSSGITFDWELVTDNGTSDQYEKLTAILDLFFARKIGQKRDTNGVTPDRDILAKAIRRVLVDGKSVAEAEDLERADQKPQTPAPVNPANQPTQTQAEQSHVAPNPTPCAIATPVPASDPTPAVEKEIVREVVKPTLSDALREVLAAQPDAIASICIELAMDRAEKILESIKNASNLDARNAFKDRLEVIAGDFASLSLTIQNTGLAHLETMPK